MSKKPVCLECDNFYPHNRQPLQVGLGQFLGKCKAPIPVWADEPNFVPDGMIVWSNDKADQCRAYKKRPNA